MPEIAKEDSCRTWYDGQVGPNIEFSNMPHSTWQRRTVGISVVLIALGLLMIGGILLRLGRYTTTTPPPIAQETRENQENQENQTDPSGDLDGASTGQSPITLTSVEHPETLVDTLAQRANPGHDDWDSEKSTNLAESQLKLLAKFVMEGHTDDEQLGTILSRNVQVASVHSSSLARVFQDQGFRVDSLSADAKMRVGENGESVGLASDSEHADQPDGASGFEGFRRLVHTWQEQVPRAASLRITFKIFRIDGTSDGFTTRVYLEVAKSDDGESFQENAECVCKWHGTGESVRLTEFTVIDTSQSRHRGPNGRLLVDCTRSVMESTAAYASQVVPGIPYWTQRIGRELMGQFGHHGLAVGDVNGDGLDDVYACDAGGLPNRLYLQQSDGTVRDVSRDSGIDLLEDSLGALLVDLDNDGDQDLAVVCNPYLQFAENDGLGHFKLRSALLLETDGYSLCAADYDQDRDLDIYLCGYNARRQASASRGLPFPLPYHDANNGGRNYLLRNDGQFQMVDVTSEVGLDVDNRRFSLAAAWEDYDNDGDQDLYVANDFGRNCLYRNTDGTFINVAALAGVEDQASGMSVSWADYDRDGWVDLYISNMFSAAGNRVTYQRRFAEGIADDSLAKVQRMARGNTLFRNRGDGTFEDTSEAAGVTQGRWAWGSRFVDLNNDGWQDLVVANGYITNEDPSDL